MPPTTPPDSDGEQADQQERPPSSRDPGDRPGDPRTCSVCGGDEQIHARPDPIPCPACHNKWVAGLDDPRGEDASENGGAA